MAKRNQPLSVLSVNKSNDFVTSKYKASLLENKIMAVAMTRIELNETGPETSLEANLYPGELLNLVSDPDHIYRDLKKTAQVLPGHTMFLEDGRGNFKSFSIVPNANYEDGVFTIKFNNELRDHLLGLDKFGNYTSYELSIMMQFNRNNTFRLYELLKKDAYLIPKDKDAYILLEYNISELKFMIGVANIDNPNVKAALKNRTKSQAVDWDLLYDRLEKSDKLYEDWRDFQKRVIVPAQEEMQERSDLRFEYKGVKEGRKTRRIQFKLYRNTPVNRQAIDIKKDYIEKKNFEFRQRELPMDQFEDLYDELIGHNKLTKEDVDLLLLKSNCNEELVRKAVAKADKKKGSIGTYMGWLVTCIENGGYEDDIEIIDGSAEKADTVKKVAKKAKEDAKNPVFLEHTWENMKTWEAFEEFLQFINMPLDVFETIYSDPKQRIEEYYKWKRGEI